MSNIYAFANEVVSDKPFLLIELNNQLELLNLEPWYHGDIDRITSESRILSNGEFLLRLSNSGKIVKFVVTTKWNGQFIHVIIKDDINDENKLVFFIDKNFKFSTITELIKFHKEQQHPLSTESGAVLYKPVDKKRNSSNGFNSRETRYRKSSHILRKAQPSVFSRCGSETQLNNKRYSENITSINKSMTDLSIAASEAVKSGPQKPDKPHIKILNSKHLLAKIRPSYIKVRNKNLYRESGDYTDYSQLKDNEAALQRESIRRGFSNYIEDTSNVSPSLIGFNSQSSRKKSIQDESTYVVASNSQFSSRRNSEISFETPVNNENTNYFHFNMYGITDSQQKYNHTSKIKKPSEMYIGLKEFINFSLSNHNLSCFGFASREFNVPAINKASSYLITNSDHQVDFCKHLIDEIKRIFEIATYDMQVLTFGYRSVFLRSSWQFIQHLKIRQTILTDFVTATIVCTKSTDQRQRLIVFWVKCAEFMHSNTKDMFHFRSIITAIFSDKIAKLRIWRHVYRQDPSIKLKMEQLRQSLKDGSLLNTDITKCLPDLVQLHDTLLGDQSSLDEIWKISNEGPFNWTANQQSFDSPETWLVKISIEMQCFPTIPFLRQLVQTETLMSLLIGNRDITFDGIADLTNVVELKLLEITDNIADTNIVSSSQN